MNKNEFLEKTVFGWIKNDIERMLSAIPAEDGRIGNINFPLALCILSYMDSLGSFLLGSGKFCFKDIIGRYLKCFKNSEEYDEEILTFIFRHGLAHSYFPKGGGVSRENQRPALYKIIVNEMDEPIVDVETLARDFLDSLNEFRNQLTNETFVNRMNEILKEVENRRTTLKTKIECLPQRQNLSYRDVTTYDPGYTSGFSGSPQK